MQGPRSPRSGVDRRNAANLNGDALMEVCADVTAVTLWAINCFIQSVD